jgi:hypothetical protein
MESLRRRTTKLIWALLNPMEVGDKHEVGWATRNHVASIGDTVADLGGIHSVPDENVECCWQNIKSQTGEGRGNSCTATRSVAGSNTK